MAEFVKRMAVEVDVVVLIASMLASANESDAVWMERCRQLMALTPGVRLGLYECPEPYHRSGGASIERKKKKKTTINSTQRTAMQLKSR